MRSIRHPSGVLIWRVSKRSRLAERSGLVAFPHPPDARCSFQSRPLGPALHGPALKARLTSLEPGVKSVTLQDLPGDKHLVLAPGRAPELFLVQPEGGVCFKLACAPPGLFGRFTFRVDVVVDRKLDEVLHPLLRLVGDATRNRAGPLTCEARLIPAMLRVLDLNAAGLSHRKIAIDAFGQARVASDWGADSYLKSRIARLARQARRYVDDPAALIRQ